MVSVRFHPLNCQVHSSENRRHGRHGGSVRLRHVRKASVLALLAMSCSLGDPADAGSLNLFVDVNPSTLSIGEEMTIIALARNVGLENLTLTGPSDCLLYVEILNNQGQVVWHSNGTCSGANVTEDLIPSGEKTRTITWRGENLAGARLAAGFYHIRPVARVTGAPYVGPPVSVALE